MKKLFRTVAILFGFFFILTGMPVKAADRTVSVGVYENAPKVFTDETGRPAGIFIDVIEFIARKEGWDLKFVPCTWGEGLDRLEAGEIDLMPDVAYSAKRAEIYSFHDVSVLSSWAQVYAGEDSGIRSILDLEGKTVAVLEGSVQQEVFARMEEEFGLNAGIIALPDYHTIFQKVRDNEADAAVTNRFYGVMHADEFGLEDTAVIFHPSDLFFATAKGRNPELLQAIDARLSELKNDKQSAYYRSLKHWISGERRFELPGWVMMAGMVLAAALVLSLLGSALLKRQVQARTRELTRLNRSLRTFSDCNQALAHSVDETGLLDSVCRILAEKGGYCMACVGVAEKDRPRMLSVAAHAFADREPEAGENTLWGDADPGRNFAIHVFQSRKIRWAQHILTDPEFSQWRDDALRRGYQSVLMLPLLHEDESFGVLGVYSPDPDGFDTQEMNLLSEIAGDLAFGITSHRTRVARDRAERERREERRRLEDIVEFLPDATFVIDEEKKVVAWNRACESMTGVKKEKLLGHGNYAYAEPFFGERRPILIDLLDLPASEVEQEYKSIERRDDRLYGESFIQRLNGGRGAHLWGVAAPLYDREGKRRGAIEVVRDVTRQKVMEKSLIASEKQYRELVTLANSIILRWSPDGRITFLNEFGLSFFGYTGNEIEGRPLVGTIVPEEESTGRDLAAIIDNIREDPKRFERNVNENIRRDGERAWIDWRNRAVFNEDGKVREILSIGSDITELKNAEERIYRLNEELKEHAGKLEKRVQERTAELAVAKEQAESADRLKSAFLATMSHELRTPLNSIIGFTGILLQGLAGPLNEEQEKQLHMVQNSSRHLLALINDVLDISKIESGQLTLSFSTFDVASVIDKSIRIVSPLAEKKDIKIHTDIAEDVSEATLDQRRLEQVVLNLLNNAVKFTDKGRVDIGCRREEGTYMLSVSDTGIGIQPEELSGLFRPFHQIDTGLSRKKEGTGLGLSISKKLMDLMNGTIHVQSTWGKGSTFTIRFPENLAQENRPT